MQKASYNMIMRKLSYLSIFSTENQYLCFVKIKKTLQIRFSYYIKLFFFYDTRMYISPLNNRKCNNDKNGIDLFDASHKCPIV